MEPNTSLVFMKHREDKLNKPSWEEHRRGSTITYRMDLDREDDKIVNKTFENILF